MIFTVQKKNKNYFMIRFFFEFERVQMNKRKGHREEFNCQVKGRTLPVQNKFITIDGSIKPGNSKEQAAGGRITEIYEMNQL